DPLTQGLAGLEWGRAAERDRRRVRLEVGVRPVAVVLRLPEVALELEQERAAIGELDLQPIVGGEERLVRTLDDRLAPDQIGEGAVAPAVRWAGAGGPRGGLARRVVDTDADPVVGEGGLRSAVEDELDPAALVADDRPVPGEVDLAAGMPHIELGPEAGVLLLELEVGDRPWHRVPID